MIEKLSKIEEMPKITPDKITELEEEFKRLLDSKSKQIVKSFLSGELKSVS